MKGKEILDIKGNGIITMQKYGNICIKARKYNGVNTK